MSEQKFASVDAGFSLTANAQRNALCFAIKGSGIGFGAWFGLIFAGVFFGAILTVLFALIGGNADRWRAEDFFSTWFFIIGLVMVCAFLWSRSRSQVFKFDITDVDVQTPDGGRYARSDISETLLRNKGTIIHNSQANVTTTHSSTVVVGTGMVGGAVAAGHAVGNVAGAVGLNRPGYRGGSN